MANIGHQRAQTTAATGQRSNPAHQRIASRHYRQIAGSMIFGTFWHDAALTRSVAQAPVAPQLAIHWQEAPPHLPSLAYSCPNVYAFVNIGEFFIAKEVLCC